MQSVPWMQSEALISKTVSGGISTEICCFSFFFSTPILLLLLILNISHSPCLIQLSQTEWLGSQILLLLLLFCFWEKNERMMHLGFCDLLKYVCLCMFRSCKNETNTWKPSRQAGCFTWPAAPVLLPDFRSWLLPGSSWPWLRDLQEWAFEYCGVFETRPELSNFLEPQMPEEHDLAVEELLEHMDERLFWFGNT